MKHKLLPYHGASTLGLFLFQTFLAACLVSLVRPAPVQAQWVRKADALRRRSEVTSVVYNNKLYTFIGFGNSALQVEPTCEVYDPATNTWSLLAPIPTGKAVTHQGVVLIDNTVWHIGGRVGQNPGPLTSEIWIYNISTNSWSPGPQLKDPATGNPLLWGGGGAALLGRTLHIFGGFVNNACNNDQDKYHLTLDVDKWRTTGVAAWENKRKPLPLKRCHIATTVLGGKIYALGGQFDHDCGEVDHEYSHVYNPITDTWTQLTNLPAPRSHAEGGVFPLDGKIYIVAGQQANSVNCNKVTVLDPAGNNGLGSWSEDPAFNLPYSYEGVSAKVIGSTFFYTHGGMNNSANPQNQTYARTINRNPIYKLGFTAACLDVTLPASSSTTKKNLLFTMEGTKSYTLSSDAAWVKITKNATGTALMNGVDVEVTISAAGLAPGKYKANITATGTGTGPSYSPASFCVNLTVGTGAASPVRLNAGGSAFTSTTGKLFNADEYFTGGQPTTYVGGEIANTTNDELYRSGRFGMAFGYNIPSGNGTFDVVLHFNETYWGNLQIGGIGSRKFNVDIENQRKLTEYDIYAKAGGAMKAVMETLRVTVTDGTLNISFTKGSADLPRVSAIEMIPATSSSTYQAENAFISQALVSNSHSGYTGTGFVDYINATSDFIEWTVNQPTTGSASLQFRYANGSTTSRFLRLQVNGVVIQEYLAFPSTGAWINWSVISVPATLQAGQNKVRLTANGTSGPNIDYLTIGASGAARQSFEASGPATSQLTLRVVPNPASDRTGLILPEVAAELKVQIISPLGTVVRQFDFTGPANTGTYELNLNGLPRGLYLIQAQGPAKSFTTRLVIE